jgi:hypothetical protein
MAKKDDKPDGGNEERIKRRHSIGRFLEKLKPKRKSRPPSLGFLSHRASTSSLSRASIDGTRSTSSLISGEKGRPPFLGAADLGMENFINLGTFNCVLDSAGSLIQGRLYITDKFFVFDSKTLSHTFRIRLDWVQILGIKLIATTQEIVFIAIKGRFKFGKFLATERPADIQKFIQATWRRSIEAKLQSSAAVETQSRLPKRLSGPRWPCGCFDHYPLVSEKCLKDSIPMEIYKQIFVGEEEPFFFPEKIGTERSIVTPLEDCLVRERLILATHTPDLIRVELTAYVHNLEGEERIVLKGRWCIVIREDQKGFITQVFLSFQQLEQGKSFEQIITRYMDEFDAQFPNSTEIEPLVVAPMGLRQKALLFYYFYGLSIFYHYKPVLLGLFCYLLGWFLRKMILAGSEEPLLIDTKSLEQQENAVADLISSMKFNIHQLINSLQD